MQSFLSIIPLLIYAWQNGRHQKNIKTFFTSLHRYGHGKKAGLQLLKSMLTK